MKGNVWMRASTNIAQLTQLCHVFSLSVDIPVNAVTMLALAPKASINGMQAKAIHPVRVAIGGEFP